MASGKNLIITHEQTFYNHLDDQAPLAADPVEQQKLGYIYEHHLVVWRFHDTWHLRQPDGILAGMVDRFGWRAYQNSADPHLFAIPPASVEQIAARLQKSTGARALPIVGDPAMTATRVALLPGASGSKSRSKPLSRTMSNCLLRVSPANGKPCLRLRTLLPKADTKPSSCLATKFRKKRGWRNARDGSARYFPGFPWSSFPAGEPFYVVRPAPDRKP